MHSQARKVATLSPPHTPRSLYLCAFFSVYSVNPSVPHIHTAYISAYSSQSVALFPPIPHSICIGLLSHRSALNSLLRCAPLVLEAQCSHPSAAVALLVTRVQRVFRADKGVLPSVFPIHAAHFCMFINVRNTLSYTSILPSHLQNRSVKTIVFHSQISSISPSVS